MEDHNDNPQPAEPKRRFRVVLAEPKRPKKGGEEPAVRYSGIHPAGLAFRDGVAETEDEQTARQALESIPGCRVLDAATNKPAWPPR